MKVSIIGAGRKRNGIGEYIGKYFHKNGTKVISVLGTTEETSAKASAALRRYGIEAIPFTDFSKMVEDERPDAVVIASPSSTHYEYLMNCVDLGLHIFCEKPFIRPDIDDPGGKVEGILKNAREKKLTVAMNSQWPFAIKYYKRICGEIEIKKANKFFISMSPFCSGKEMIPESVPHALSLLYVLLGQGLISDLKAESVKGEEVTLKFKYLSEARNCAVLIKLAKREEQPRDLQFGWNDKIVRRSLNLKNYDIYLSYGKKRLKIADPLELSVRNFIEAVEKGEEPLIGHAHIMNNTCLLKEIYDGLSKA